MKTIQPNFKINNYPMYGLNRYRSFMKAPTCECGCGQPAMTVLPTDDDVGDFCATMLYEHQCPESAIFAVFHDGRLRAYIKTWDEESGEYVAICVESIDKDIHMFSKLDGEYRFCCYNLIIEQEPGLWMIQS